MKYNLGTFCIKFSFCHFPEHLLQWTVCLWLQSIPSEYQNDESSRHKTLGMYMMYNSLPENSYWMCHLYMCLPWYILPVNPTFCGNGMFLWTMILVHLSSWIRLITSRLFIFYFIWLHWCYLDHVFSENESKILCECIHE